MITDQIKRIFNNKPVKFMLALVLLLAVLLQVGPYVIDSKSRVDAISASLAKQFGGALEVKGGSQFRFLPEPALILKNVSWTEPSNPQAPTVTVGVVELAAEWTSLLSANPRLSSVKMAGASFVANTKEDGKIEWGAFGGGFLKQLVALKTPYALPIQLIDAQWTIANKKTGSAEGISHLNLSGVWGEESQFSGNLEWQGKPIQLVASKKGRVGATPIALTFSDAAGSTASLTADMDFTTDDPVISGTIDVSLANIAKPSDQEKPKEASPFDIITNKSTDAPDAVVMIPLKLKAEYQQQQGSVTLKNVDLSMLENKAKGTAIFSLDGSVPHSVSLAFEPLDIGLIRNLVRWIETPRPTDGSRDATLFNRKLNVALELNAANILNGTQRVPSASFIGSISQGALTVNRLTFNMPGESSVSLFGLISSTDTQGTRFEGNIEASGKSLREMLTVFDDSATSLPELGFGNFSLNSNLFISKELLRLSESKATFSELTFKGGLVTYFDQVPRIEAEVGLSDINFDYFRDSWRKSAQENHQEGYLIGFNKVGNYDWLKKLGASIDFKIDVQKFHFLERDGSRANFRLFAKSGEFGIYNAKFYYDTDTTETNFKLDVTGEHPTVNLVLNTNHLNTNYFAVNPQKEEIAPTVESVPVEHIDLPEMKMPEVTPEEELRRKIDEEAGNVSVEPQAIDALSSPAKSDSGELTPLIEPKPDAAPVETNIQVTPQSLLISDAHAQEPAGIPVVEDEAPAKGLEFSDALLDTGWMDGINGNFDISIGALTHKTRLFENVKILAKLERNLLTFQTLTFAHWGGSFSVNGTIFGGRVPGVSLGIVAASADIGMVLEDLLDIQVLNGRMSLSGTFDTSGVNLASWASQAKSKLLFSARGLKIKGFDIASVPSSVSASRTASDIFDNVNLAIVGGTGEYSADGAFNLENGVLGASGVALKTGRITGLVNGDLRLLKGDMDLSGTFKFPTLPADTLPTITTRWSGPINHPRFQTDTQSLEAYVSKRITGN